MSKPVFHPQQQIGPYTLVRLLGQGGFGEVWLAEKRGALMTAQVAVKLPLDPDPDLDAVRYEAQTWLRASGHPNVLPVIEADIYNGQVVIVSEHAAGGSLSSWLKQHGGKAPSVEAAVAMTVGILAGLDHLHHLATPIIHRDLKPDNVLLQGDMPRLTDCGISRVLKTTAQTQHSSGTPHYMPPEAFGGNYSPRSDVWAAGVILYQMLTGHLPFPQSDMPSLYGAILTGAPAPLPAHVPESVRNVVMSALEKDPARRLQSASAMRALLSQPLSQSPPVSTAQPQNNYAPQYNVPPSSSQPAPPMLGATLPPTLGAGATPAAKKPAPTNTRTMIAAVVGSCAFLALCGVIGVVMLIANMPDKDKTSQDMTTQTTTPGQGNAVPPPDSNAPVTLSGHTAAMFSASMSADGKRVITSGADKKVKLWDAQTGSELRTLAMPDYVSVFLSADGTRFLTIKINVKGDEVTANNVKVWDAETGTELRTLSAPDYTITGFALSADGRRVMTVGQDKKIKVWDAETGTTLIESNQGEYIAADMSADGKRLVRFREDKTVKMWDVDTTAILLTLNAPTYSNGDVTISADGKRIVTYSTNIPNRAASNAKSTEMKVWDAETGNELRTLNMPDYSVNLVVASADGKRIATNSKDKIVKVWDVETGAEILTLDAQNHADVVSMSADGKRMVTCGDGKKTATVWPIP